MLYTFVTIVGHKHNPANIIYLVVWFSHIVPIYDAFNRSQMHLNPEFVRHQT